ncbi:hypothetical protein CLAIMM_02903 [Cladophialophora immunda]|nr:hypothetical protein CLAIMM_02903 [Cladophialophora immunda]
MRVKKSGSPFRYSGPGRHFSGKIGHSKFGRHQKGPRQKIFLQRNISKTIGQATGGPNSSATEVGGAAKGAVANGAETADNAFTTSSRSELIVFKMPSRSSPSNGSARNGEPTTRRSIRGLLNKPYDDPQAEMTLDLTNIRKKLNFGTNSISNKQRMAKRQKLDHVDCRCHLTIWDNRGSGASPLPLVTKSTYCRSINIDNGVHAIDNYFLELKIIPCAAEPLWHPVPILGKSDGDHFTADKDVRELGFGERQGAIVARYMHLPDAPEWNVPLSVFYLLEGCTYRTKYGLQVKSTWERADVANEATSKLSKGLDLDSFRLAKQKRTRLPVRAKEEQPPLPEEAPVGLKICYKLSGTIREHADAGEFRNTIVEGYGCPICPERDSHRLHELLSHFKSAHEKYDFSPSKQHRNPTTKKLTRIEMKVDTLVGNGRKESDEAIPPYENGDQDLTEGEAPLQPLFNSNRPFGLSLPTRTGPRYPLAAQVPDFREPTRKKAKAVLLQTRYPEREQVWTSSTHRPISPSEDPHSETDDEVDNSWQIEAHMESLDAVADKQGWSNNKRELTKRWDRHRMEERLEHSRYVSNSLIRFVRKQRVWLKNGDDELWQIFFDFLGSLKERRVIDDNVVADVNEFIFHDPPSDQVVDEMATREAVLDHAPSGTVASEGDESSGANSQVHDISGTGTTGEAEPSSQSDEAHLQLETSKEAPSPPCEQAELEEACEEPQHLIARDFKCGACLLPIKRLHMDTTYCTVEDCGSPGTKYHKRCALGELRVWNENRMPVRGDLSGPLPEVDKTAERNLKRWACRDCILKRWMNYRIAGHRGRMLVKRTQTEKDRERERGQEKKKKKKREEMSLLKMAALGSWNKRLREREAEQLEASSKGEEVVRDPCPQNESTTESPAESDSDSSDGYESDSPIEGTLDGPSWSSSGIAVQGGIVISLENSMETSVVDTRVMASADTPVANEWGLPDRGRARIATRDRSRTPARDRSIIPYRNRSATPIRKRMGTPIANKTSLPLRMGMGSAKRHSGAMRMGSPKLKAHKGPVATLKARANAAEKAKVAARVLAINERSGPSNLRFGSVAD